MQLKNELHIPAPFDLIYRGRRLTVKEAARFEVKSWHQPLYNEDNPFAPLPPSVLASQSMRLFIGEQLTHEGDALGSCEFGQIKNMDAGDVELWLDPRFVRPVI